MAAAGAHSLPLLLAALCILISTAFAGNAPTVTEITSNEDVQQALGKAWKESFNSNSNSNSNTQRGGWIYADSNYPDDHKYLLVQHATKQRSQQQDADGHIQLDNPEKEGAPSSEHYKLVADFHTHIPTNSHDDQRPDSDDIKRAYERGVPGILVSCSGIFNYGPQRRASLDGPNGYPLSSPESYNGQKDVRFGDNKFAPQANCNP